MVVPPPSHTRVCVCMGEGCGCGAGTLWTLCTTMHSVRASGVACARLFGLSVWCSLCPQPATLHTPCTCALRLRVGTLLSRHLTPVRPQCRTSSSVTLRNSLCQVIRVYIQHRLLRQNSWLWCDRDNHKGISAAVIITD